MPMKRILFLLVLLFPGYLFAQSDSLQALNTEVTFDETQEEGTPVLTWKDRREPFLAGFLSYLCPGAGQVYNKQYEKALGIVAVIGYSYYQGVQSSGTGNDTYSAICALGICGAYFFSLFDAIISAKKINRTIELQLSRNTSLSLKPDFQLTRKPMAFGVSGVEPVLGLRLKLSL